MKVALVQAPAWGTTTPPIALASLSAYLRSRGHDVLVLDLNIELYRKLSAKYPAVWHMENAGVFWPDPAVMRGLAAENAAYLDGRAAFIAASGAKVVGFSVYFSSLDFSLDLARRIRKKAPGIRIVFGGPQADRRLDANLIMKSGVVDFAVQGEGELTLAEIVENPKAGSFCEGALIRRKGKVLDCGDREPVRDLDKLPPPDLSDFDLGAYLGLAEVPILSSRGCCNRCVFCHEHSYWRGFRSRGASGVYREILLRLKSRPGTKFFCFQDAMLNGNIRELEKLADLLIKSGLDISWRGNAAIRKEMTYRLLRKLRRAGCIELTYGLETASVPLMVRAGKLLARGADPAKILRDGHRAGVGCMLNLMFGLPGETERDFSATLDFLRKNKRYIGGIFPTPFFCCFPPGTYGADHPERLGIKLAPDDEHYWVSEDGTNNYLVRLSRFERLLKAAREFGIRCHYPGRRLLNRNELLGRYYLHIGEAGKAEPYLARAVKREGLDPKSLPRPGVRT